MSPWSGTTGIGCQRVVQSKITKLPASKAYFSVHNKNMRNVGARKDLVASECHCKWKYIPSSGYNL